MRKRQRAREHLVEHCARRVDIISRPAGTAFGLLARHLCWRDNDWAFDGAHHLSACKHLSNAKVGDFQLPVVGRKLVCRLDIAVHDALAMGMVHARERGQYQATATGRSQAVTQALLP